MKTCYCCRQEKKLSEFIKCKFHVGGFSNLCKECKLEKQRIRRRQKSKERKESGQFNIRKKEPIPENHKKICRNCLIEKDFTEFHKLKVGKWGLSPQCIVCRKQQSLIWRSRNSERVKDRQRKYNKNHREEFKKYNKKYSLTDKYKKTRAKWTEKNKQKILLVKKKHRETDKYKQRYKKWCQKNKDKIKKYGLNYWAKHHEALLIKYRNLAKIERESLSDTYVKAYLKYWIGDSSVTKENILIKREQLKLKRKIHEKERNTPNLK